MCQGPHTLLSPGTDLKNSSYGLLILQIFPKKYITHNQLRLLSLFVLIFSPSHFLFFFFHTSFTLGDIECVGGFGDLHEGKLN